MAHAIDIQYPGVRPNGNGPLKSIEKRYYPAYLLVPRACAFQGSEFELTANGFTGYLRTSSAQGKEHGRFAGSRL